MVERFLSPVEIPDGEYVGKMSGHEIEFEYEGKQVFVETELGVRGINCPVRFRIAGNRVDESTIIHC